MAASSVTLVTQLNPSGIPTLYSLAGGELTSTYNNGVRSNTVYESFDLGWQDMGTVQSFNDVLAAATDVTYVGNTATNTLSFSTNLTNGLITTGAGTDRVSASSVFSSTIDTGIGADELDLGNLRNGSSVFMQSGNDFAFIGIVDSSTLNMGSGNDTARLGTVNFSTIGMSTANTTGADMLTVTGYATYSTFTGSTGTQNMRFESDVYNITVSTGGGNDVVNVFGRIDFGSEIDMSADNDTLTGTFGATSSTINMGSGNDSLILGGMVQGTTILMGSGADTANFSGLLINSTVNLGGADNAIDTVIVSSLSTFDTGSTITGASNGDILRATSSGLDYVFNSTAGGFVNGSTIVSF